MNDGAVIVERVPGPAAVPTVRQEGHDPSPLWVGELVADHGWPPGGNLPSREMGCTGIIGENGIPRQSLSITELRCGDEFIASPTWEQVKARLIGLPDEKTVSISIGDDAWLIALCSAGTGYLVTGHGQGERDYFTVIDRALGDEPVTAFDGGNENEHPRYAFVGKSLALRVLETFYLTGRRDGDAEWVRAEDAMY